jgi:putative ABC transport system ATP-binding protein
MTTPIISAQHLKKEYRMSKDNIIHALNDVSVDIHTGDFSAIIGPSGCGKSTLMHILGLLDKPDAGSLTIEGQDVMKMNEAEAVKFRANRIGFIFQGFNLLPSLTAIENVMLAGKYGGLSSSRRRTRATELLDRLGLKDRMHHKPNELSGGQQQRVSIARALINNPTIILADEPTGELDSATSLEIITLLKKLNQENHQTFVLVTHNHEVAEQCRQIIKLKDGRNDK